LAEEFGDQGKRFDESEPLRDKLDGAPARRWRRFAAAALPAHLREIAAHGRAGVEVPEGVGGRVTLKLVEVPWDQAFDLRTCVNGLTWTRTGDVIHVEVRKTVSSR